MRSDSLSILHVEDDPLWCEAVRLAVEALPGGCDYLRGASRSDSLQLARVRRPGLVLLDLRLPDADGFALAEELSRELPARPILILSVRSDEAALLRIIRQSCIAGLVWKSGGAASLLPKAIPEVLAGHKYYSPEVREALRKFRADPQAFFKILSDREIGLLPNFGRGLTDDEIAARTGLSALTVKSHRQHIMAKLGLHRTPELIYWAIEHGFVDPPPRVGWVREDPE